MALNQLEICIVKFLFKLMNVISGFHIFYYLWSAVFMFQNTKKRCDIMRNQILTN